MPFCGMHACSTFGCAVGLAWCQAPSSHSPSLQVALLFLVKGPFHHEALWRLWFQSAAGLLPADSVAGSLCGVDGGSNAPSTAHQRRVLQACSSMIDVQQAAAATAAGASAPVADAAGRKGMALLSGSASTPDPAAGAPAAGPSHDTFSGSSGGGSGTSSGSSVLEQQVLFDVYVHPHPSFPGEPTWLCHVLLPPACCLAVAPLVAALVAVPSVCPAILLPLRTSPYPYDDCLPRARCRLPARLAVPWAGAAAAGASGQRVGPAQPGGRRCAAQ